MSQDPQATQAILDVVQQYAPKEGKEPVPLSQILTEISTNQRIPMDNNWRLGLILGSKYVQDAEQKAKKVKSGLMGLFACIILILLFVLGILISTSITANRLTNPVNVVVGNSLTHPVPVVSTDELQGVNGQQGGNNNGLQGNNSGSGGGQQGNNHGQFNGNPNFPNQM